MPCKQACLAALSSLALLLAAACATDNAQRVAIETQDAAAAQAGKEAFRQSRFQDAASSYMRAIALSQDPAASAKYKAALADIYREWALRVSYANKDATTADDYSKAISLCFAAIEMHPPERSKCEALIARFQERISILKYRASVAERDLIPYDKPKHEQVAVYLAQARAWSKAGCYDTARKRLEKALSIDPANAEVAQELAAVENKLAATPSSDLAQLDAKRVYVAEAAWRSSPEPQKAPAADAATSLRNAFILKLDLKDATLREAFATLTPPDGSISFSFEGFPPDSKEFPLITFKGENLSLEDALRSLCSSAKLSFVPGAGGRVAIFKAP